MEPRTPANGCESKLDGGDNEMKMTCLRMERSWAKRELTVAMINEYIEMSLNLVLPGEILTEDTFSMVHTCESAFEL